MLDSPPYHPLFLRQSFIGKTGEVLHNGCRQVVNSSFNKSSIGVCSQRFWFIPISMHFLSNAIPLALFSSLLYGYFGPSIFPGLMILLGCIIHLITLLTYPSEVTLVGASGVVYCMAGFWLMLYVLIERRFSIGKRLVRSLGFVLIVFVPSVIEPTVSYRAHAIGFFLGVISGLIYFTRKREKIRQSEEIDIDEDLEAPRLLN